MNIYRQIVGMISTLCGWVAAGMIVVSVAITCQMIFVRAILNESTIWQTEAVVYLMISATLLGLPYVQKLRGHVNVDLLPMILPPSARKSLVLFTLFASIVVIGVMVFYGYEQWYEAFRRNWKSDTVWGVRLWIPYAALPIGFGLFLLQLSADFLAVATDHEDAASLGASE